VLSFLKRIIGNYLFRRERVKYAACVEIADSAHYVPHRVHFKNRCNLKIGKQSMLACHIFFEKENASLSIGQRTYIGNSSLMCATNIEIGDDVTIAFETTIVDHDSHSPIFSLRSDDLTAWLEGRKKNWDDVKMSPVRIANRVWIGMHVIILEGITIGEGAVIGAGSVVTKDVPPYTLVAGNPARPIRSLEQPS
jgi:galactoside O-acetyltransferase